MNELLKFLNNYLITKNKTNYPNQTNLANKIIKESEIKDD
jgi:hypothetical protein